ncbi:MAG: NAD-dependent epimerase/dehydratase family protein [Bacteroidetes bacterium]|nr:NAD-dependent epimerase/dehydratase family protein [Bacteroidota bacterium]
MQTILGGGGAIGIPLAKELTKYTDKIKIVSRNAKKVNSTDITFNADITKKEEIFQAIKGSEIVYLTAGLKYTTKTWQEHWPAIMENVIEGCKRESAKLVFFDNVYMYGRVEGEMTEETPFHPCSKKGEIRAKLDLRFMDEYKKGDLQGVIVRGADFYGPGVGSSMFNLLVIDNLIKGKKANWMNNPKAFHTFTYTPDAAYATALIGNTPSTYNQVWHAPSEKKPITGEEMIRIAGEYMGIKPKIQVFSNGMLFMAGLFNPTIMSMIEMSYQFKYDYIFNSDKFKKAFNFTPTSYKAGIKACVEAAKK